MKDKSYSQCLVQEEAREARDVTSITIIPISLQRPSLLTGIMRIRLRILLGT